jgi:hypothetical protein
LGLVLAEWAADPFWRQGWHHESRAAERWLHASMATMVTLLFLFTRNLWVCFVLHLLLESVFWRIGREPALVEASQ